MNYCVIQIKRVNSWFNNVTRREEENYYLNVVDEIKQHLKEQYPTAIFEVKVKEK
jgi:hypothetical protein